MKKGILSKSLNIIEKVGNALPHPATIFALFSILVIILSAIIKSFGVKVIHPGTGKEIEAISLLTIEGLHRIITSLVTNFTAFAPLGTVLVSMLGIGIAERSGFIGAVLRLLVLSSPKKLLTFVIVLAGVLSNTASEIGYVLLVPLSAIIFLAAGRHPVAGFAAAFAGVSGGYSANLLLGTIDPLLAGLSQEAAHILEPAYTVNPAANYYFMFVSTFFIAIAGTWVTEKIVEPRLGKYKGEEKPEEIKKLEPGEKRGMLFAMFTIAIFTIIILLGLIPSNGYLRDIKTLSILNSPFLNGIVAFIFFGGAVAGIAYGIGARTIKNDSDVMKGMDKAIETLGSYIVLVFFAAQFVAFFNWTNIGLIIAVSGANLLKTLGLGSVPLIISFIILSAFINLVIGSASAKWAIMAPIFVPMFMILGFTPEFTQAAYRVGDSVTNIISPMMSYFALLIAMVQRYDKQAGIGTLVATMLPYSIVFFIIWTVLIIIWMILDLPIGAGAGIFK